MTHTRRPLAVMALNKSNYRSSSYVAVITSSNQKERRKREMKITCRQRQHIQRKETAKRKSIPKQPGGQPSQPTFDISRHLYAPRDYPNHQRPYSAPSALHTQPLIIPSRSSNPPSPRPHTIYTIIIHSSPCLTGAYCPPLLPSPFPPLPIILENHPPIPPLLSPLSRLLPFLGLLTASTSSGGSISNPGIAAAAAARRSAGLPPRMVLLLPSSAGMGELGRSRASDSAWRAGVVPEAGVPRARVESPKRASMSSRRTPQVSG